MNRKEAEQIIDDIIFNAGERASDGVHWVIAERAEKEMWELKDKLLAEFEE